MINLSTMIDMYRDSYSPEQLAKIKALKEKYRGKIIC
jgi:hypothetical protein